MSDSQNSENHNNGGIEPLTPEELEKYLSRVRAEGRSLTSEEQYAIFGPPKAEVKSMVPVEEVDEMEAADLDPDQVALLTESFFSGFEDHLPHVNFSLIQGVIFDFDHTLAQLTRPKSDLLEEGARNTEAYMRSSGMMLPDNFWENIIEARRFSEEKSAEEQEEHIADDAMSFLLQFYGYPASKMDPKVLRRAVDIFYAPEMMAWRARPESLQVMETLHGLGYKLAVVDNYNCERVFQRVIDYSGFRPFLDICIASASVEYRKPDKRIFELVLERWDAQPHEVVIVGDSLLEDIQGAAELGAYSVQMLVPTSSQVHFDNQQVIEQIKPDKAILSFLQLPEIIQNWAG